MKELLTNAAQRAQCYLDTVNDRPVRATDEAIDALSAFDRPLPSAGMTDCEVLNLLDEVGSPATVATNGARFFGFVIGGALPATMASSWLAAAWDQNAGLWAGSPIDAKLEEVTLRWLNDLLGVPQSWGGAFVTGATMANFTALAAGRNALYHRLGYDIENQGLFGAPELTVLVGGEAHPSLTKGLGMLGLGRTRYVSMPVDRQGRVVADQVPKITGPTLVCLQAGNVNTGAFDPIAEIVSRLSDRGNCWVHVDGAFGFWACVSDTLRPLIAGIDTVDSICTDAHKWLNVPYDSGIVMTADPVALKRAMSYSTSYLLETDRREPSHYTPELSRAARGINVWAALASLGQEGLTELIERNCRQARRFAEGLSEAGFTIHNDIVLNQVLVSFGTPDQTRAVIEAIQRDGTCWAGVTEWQGHTAMRISVCNYSTTDQDVERSLQAMLRCAEAASTGA